jgi:hypothetical protein
VSWPSPNLSEPAYTWHILVIQGNGCFLGFDLTYFPDLAFELAYFPDFVLLPASG